MPIFRVKSVKIYTGQKNLHWRRQRQWQLSGMSERHLTGKVSTADLTWYLAPKQKRKLKCRIMQETAIWVDTSSWSNVHFLHFLKCAAFDRFHFPMTTDDTNYSSCLKMINCSSWLKPTWFPQEFSKQELLWISFPDNSTPYLGTFSSHFINIRQSLKMSIFLERRTTGGRIGRSPVIPSQYGNGQD